MKQTSERAVYDLQQIFGWLVEYKIRHDGNSPSLAEMMRACCISSKSVARNQLERMRRLGLIAFTGAKQARCICIVGGEWRWHGASSQGVK